MFAPSSSISADVQAKIDRAVANMTAKQRHANVVSHHRIAVNQPSTSERTAFAETTAGFARMVDQMTEQIAPALTSFADLAAGSSRDELAAASREAVAAPAKREPGALARAWNDSTPTARELTQSNMAVHADARDAADAGLPEWSVADVLDLAGSAVIAPDDSARPPDSESEPSAIACRTLVAAPGAPSLPFVTMA